MKNNNSIFNVRVFSQLVSLLFLLSLPLAESYAGACCSRHGGVVGCNAVSGFQTCKDGTSSPSCKCSKSKAATPAVKSKTTSTTTVTKPTTTSKPLKTKTSTTTTTSSKGCCSRHGGIAQCNTSTGFQMCKDGSASPSCKCK